MRIIQIINALTLGGAQFLLLDLAIEARKAGHHVEIVCFRDGPIGNTLRHEGFTVHVLGETILDLPACYKLIKILKAGKPDIIHSHLFRATFWARVVCMAFTRARLITSIHGCETRLFHHIEKFLSRSSDFLVFPSIFLQNWYTNAIRSLKTSESAVIFPGVTIRPLLPASQPQEIIRIGTLSRLHPVKGIDRLIRACGELKQQGIPFKLYIGGNGKHRNELQTLAAQLGINDSCLFCGEVSNRDSFLSELDIFVAPSRQEAFGIHICEAMERGLPAAGARVGGIPEIIKHQETGLLFDPEDIASLTETLKTMIKDKNFRLAAGTRARCRVEELFNRVNATNKHLEIYEKLAVSNKKIHFAISSNELGGGERVALGIMRALQQRGWQITATCAGEPLAAAISKAGISCSVSNMLGGGIFFAARLLRDIAAIKPAIISTHLNKASLIGGLLGRLFSTATVSHVHGLNQHSYYRFSDSLIAVSTAVKSHLLKQNMPAEQITTIANCIEKPALMAKPAISGQLRIAITAKLHHNKGHSWALEAIASEKHPAETLKVMIIGDGPERTALEKLCQHPDLKEIVKFTGFVDNPEVFYPEIDVALLPSLGEGIPLSLLEAMRWGIPCIASNIGGIPEIITHNENGLLITPGNAKELLDAINIMRDPLKYEAFSRSAIEHFQRLNNYEKMISDLESHFISVIESKK